MKSTALITRIVLVLAAAWLGMEVSGGCTVESRSPAYRCNKKGDCPGGRTCDSGWCVAEASDAALPIVPDATPGRDASACDPQCTECDENNTCIIRCEGFTEACEDRVICPAGQPCLVECIGPQSCRQGVRCDNASRCEVVCAGEGSCQDKVECGTGPCVVHCDGLISCNGGVSCQDACSCDTTCPSFGICRDDHECPEGCTGDAGQCQSDLASCTPSCSSGAP